MTLPFEKFWAWISTHPNCIVRAGTPEAILFDHDDFHWHLAAEDESTYIVQLARGKELVGEIVLLVQDIAYVQCEVAENEEFVCECIVEGETAREAVYQFVMSHPFDEGEAPTSRRWTH